MQNQSNYGRNYEHRLERVQAELLELILEEDSVYPWNPTSPEAEAYFAALDSGIDEWLDMEDVPQRSEHFFSMLHQCWEVVPSQELESSLLKRFGSFVPAELLSAIATGATQVVTTNLSHLEKLVESVQPILSYWAEEDLEIFARPLAYAMRGKNNLEATIFHEEMAAWEQLSSVEQAKATMAIANYALLHIQEQSEK
ncbi:MAG: hypothetical protein SAJ37_09490 [Oscillatoria sp. PMC 1068.18]|nr:hypothetical protein [Oscillatoria sp. PMC 1076.18]MEC4988968.1 hypothetical protein [Oscillatoria sp. PMC 1068.18]